MSLSRALAVRSCMLLGLAACGGEPAPASPPARAGGAPGSAPSAPASSAPLAATPISPAAPSPGGPPGLAAIFARLRPHLVRCYEQGLRSTPEMREGKLTLNASVEASGRTTCVIPSDDTGLTQEVEDCMAARFLAERFEAGAAWSAVVPVVVRGGEVALGERRPAGVVIESIQTHRMPDAFEVLEGLQGDLQTCTQGFDRSSATRSMLVGARVGADGRAECALSTSSGPMPAQVAECAAGVLRRARFPAPRGGAGLVLVPINVLGSN